MAVITKTIRLNTQGNADVVDITPHVSNMVRRMDIKDGIVNISLSGSTGAITTCEYEPGLIQDIKDVFNKLIPAGHYRHDQAWGDGNGHSHLRSSVVGSSASFSFNDRKMNLGTWQQIIFIDFDNRSRQRELICQFVGE